MTETHLVLGASGGIGRALEKLLKAAGHDVVGLSRTEDRWPAVDLRDEQSISTASQALRDRGLEHLHGIYICSGLLHTRDIRPERRMKDLQSTAFETVMRVNALGPLQFVSALLPMLDRKLPTRIAAISARVGSISDNRLGGWTSYRCSKAALNMGMRNAAIELNRTHPLARVTLFHPGTTDTRLSQPFQSNIAPEKLFSAERAAQQFLQVLDKRPDNREAVFLDWAGKPIEF